MKTQSQKRLLWTVVLFVFLFNAAGWLGWSVAKSEDSQEAKDLGNLIWLVSPLLLSLLMRLINKDWHDLGLKPNFRGNGKWYLFSLGVFPLILSIILLIGWVFKGVIFTDFTPGLFVQLVSVGFFPTLFKNIFEEFTWRGYLTPKVNELVRKSWLGHLIVGFIWGTWHIPYYLGLLDRTVLSSYTTLAMTTFLPLVILGITIAGILFGELRLITGSTIPVLLMHTMSNVLIVTLLVEGFVELKPETAFLFTPSWEGFLTMIFIGWLGLWLVRRQNK
ncbi:MAG: CPBP family intramembrane metalloprotease [Anaerolineaceae bacterium]|nr:CPBP family intramembrane metalloprotease [Anaerolineaceae bacterium]